MKPTPLAKERDRILDIVADRILSDLIDRHTRDRIRAHHARERVKVRAIIEGKVKA